MNINLHKSSRGGISCMNIHQVANNLNILGDFLAKRDIDVLTSDALYKKYKMSQVDILILFGGSIPHGCDVAANAVKRGIAKRFMIVGGEGHTTQSLREAVNRLYPKIDTEKKKEADIMNDYIISKYGLHDILIERESTNCGNNVSYAFEVIKQNNLNPRSLLLIQDSTMQRRMDSGFHKYRMDQNLESISVINFAAYRVKVKVIDEKLTLEPSDLWGMWNIERYITLLMGEIPRLSDDKEGYGPMGKGFIAHVDIPLQVLNAFNELKKDYGDFIRIAHS